MSETNDEKEARESLIRALLEERRGYEMHGNTDSVKQVDAELKRLGAEAKAPAKRSSKRG